MDRKRLGLGMGNARSERINTQAVTAFVPGDNVHRGNLSTVVTNFFNREIFIGVLGSLAPAPTVGK